MSRRTPAIQAPEGFESETRYQLHQFFNHAGHPPTTRETIAPWVKPDTYEFDRLTTRRETREERINGNAECGVRNFFC